MAVYITCSYNFIENIKGTERGRESVLKILPRNIFVIFISGDDGNKQTLPTLRNCKTVCVKIKPNPEPIKH